MLYTPPHHAREPSVPPTPLDPKFLAALCPEIDPLPRLASEITALAPAARDHLPAPQAPP